jgi:hypothetical protein
LVVRQSEFYGLGVDQACGSSSLLPWLLALCFESSRTIRGHSHVILTTGSNGRESGLDVVVEATPTE